MPFTGIPLSDAAIQAQMDLLNADFRNFKAGQVHTRGYHAHQ